MNFRHATTTHELADLKKGAEKSSENASSQVEALKANTNKELATATNELVHLKTFIQGVKASTNYEIEQLWTSADSSGDAASDLIKALNVSIEDLKTSTEEFMKATSKEIEELKGRVDQWMGYHHAHSSNSSFTTVKGDEGTYEASAREQKCIKHAKVEKENIAKVSGANHPANRKMDMEPFNLPVKELSKEPVLQGLRQTPDKEPFEKPTLQGLRQSSIKEPSKEVSTKEQDPYQAEWESIQGSVELERRAFNRENQKYQAYVKDEEEEEECVEKKSEAVMK